jgi:3-keto-5-aminohexanoate cleavage enzyme
MHADLRGKLVVNVCLTGMVGRKRHNPHLPVTVAEIARDAEACIALGASMVHVHARDDDEEPDWRPEPYQEIVSAIRAISEEVIVCVSTSGRKVTDLDRRAACLAIDPRPDMASLTLGSLNFLREGVVNAPATIRGLAERMNELGVKPELEIFDIGMARTAATLIGEGLVARPAFANILLGNAGTASTALADAAAILSHLPEETVRCVAGIGGHQLHANLLGVLYGDGVRVGLEDNLFFDSRKTPTTNAQLVERIVRLGRELELEPATPREVRKALAL